MTDWDRSEEYIRETMKQLTEGQKETHGKIDAMGLRFDERLKAMEGSVNIMKVKMAFIGTIAGLLASAILNYYLKGH